jgi:putative DNA primase/helicase
MNLVVKDQAQRFARGALSEGFVFEAVHEYTNTLGEPLFWRIRLKHPRTGEKWIRPMCHVDGRYQLKEPAFPNGKPLYGLRAVARRPKEPVFLVEGEKCVDALDRKGIVAVTSGSADSVEKTDWQPLAGRTVRVWPDNDEAGARYAKEASEKLRALGCSVSVIDIEKLGLAAKQDCVDWIAMHPNATTTDVKALPVVVEQPAPTPVPVPAAVPEEPSIARLAALSRGDYHKVRRVEAKRLGLSLTALDAEVQDARKERERSDVEAMFRVVEPSQEPVNAATLLDEIHQVLRSFIVCDEETSVAATLWIAFTWFIEHVQVAPLAVITAPEKRCGKSQLLSLIGALSRRPMTASNISPSALFRVISKHTPTLLIDEADTFLRDNEELRGIINSGHTRQSAFVVRTQGEEHEPRCFSTWGAKALSGIGTLADTLMDRAVVLQLRRKLPGEEVERLRHADRTRFDHLASQLARFEADAHEAIASARPSLPKELNDRAQDNWEPLLAIADLAGGAWPRRAREAARKLAETKESTASVSVELLADVHEVFETTGLDRISSADLLKRLNGDEMKRWATHHRGQPMTAREFAKVVGEFGVKGKYLRFGEVNVRGYYARDFEDAFKRYLSSQQHPDSSATLWQNHESTAKAANSDVADEFGRSATICDVADVVRQPWNVADGVADEVEQIQRCRSVADARNDDEEEEIIEVVL